MKSPARPVTTLPRFGQVVVIAALMVACCWTIASPASAATAGRAAIYKSDQSSPLSGGGSAVPYAVLLPLGARCPGDTAHQQFFVYSYLLPTGIAPTDVAYKGDFPSKGLGLIAGGEYYGGRTTAVGTGRIENVPADFVWTRLNPEMVFSGRQSAATWSAGIGCADRTGKLTNYWNFTVRFQADAKDPGGFTWTVLDNPASRSDGFPWRVVLPLLAALLIGSLAIGLYRRARRVASEPQATAAP